LFVVVVAELIAAASSSPTSSPPKSSPSLFRQRLLIYLFPRIEGRPIGRGCQTFRAFGKQLTALLAKILAFHAIILAF
jgi:hypothetical protein